MEFADMHVFQYSPRKGTPAAAMDAQIDPRVKHRRSEEMLNLARASRRAFMERFVGTECDVLVEGRADGSSGRHIGKTANYLDVACAAEEGDDPAGRLCGVHIDGICEDFLIGRVIRREK
jgi:threonylcarbamoyladenosine tRNA methylthiotransferase MtaB